MGTIKNTTVCYNGLRWSISFQTEYEEVVEPRPKDSVVGIDVGVANFAALSTRELIAPLNSFKKVESKLAKEQKKLSRKTKFSNNWKKQKRKIRRVHAKIADTRKDFLHKLSTNISKNHAVVVLEDLKVSNLSKSAKGTKEDPGKNVKQKSGLNKSILDQGWHMFKTYLEYKQNYSGGEVVLVAPHHTSQKCFKCESISQRNRLSQSKFSCVACGHEDHADINAALNIQAAGTAVLAYRYIGAGTRQA